MQDDLTRTTLGVIFIGALILATFLIMQPFLGAIVWATMIVIATWPLMLRVQARAGGRRWVAVTIMTIAMLVVLVLPLSLAIVTIAGHADEAVEWAKSLSGMKLPPPPEFIEKIPLIGSKIASAWRDLLENGPAEFAPKVTPYLGKAAQWFASQVGSVGLLVVQFLLTVVIAAIMYASGETAARGVVAFGRRLAGERGEDVARLAAQAIRGVALGIVVTAIAQSVLGGIGLAIAGVPFAPVLTAVMFMLCIAQLGPMLVLIPAVVWLYYSDQTGWGTVLLVWSLVVGTMDNFLRPMLIKMGADLPLLLIFAGVIGGLFAFGLIGLFVGPVVLAVTYMLVQSWIEGGVQAAPERRTTGSE